MNENKLHFAWVVSDPQTPRPPVNTSPFLKQWRAMHKLTCSDHGEIAHVFHGLYFGEAPMHLYTDLECLGCGEHYREAA